MDTACTMLFYVTKGIARQAPLIKSMLMDSDLRSYLAALLVAALFKAGDAIRVPKKDNMISLTEYEFENFLAI